MDSMPEAERLAAEIRHACWIVRSYRRPLQREQRAQAIARLGHTVRHAFASSEDFERLLAALVEGLQADDYRPPF